MGELFVIIRKQYIIDYMCLLYMVILKIRKYMDYVTIVQHDLGFPILDPRDGWQLLIFRKK
jgi:hypothetical protein